MLLDQVERSLQTSFREGQPSEYVKIITSSQPICSPQTTKSQKRIFH